VRDSISNLDFAQGCPNHSQWLLIGIFKTNRERIGAFGSNGELGEVGMLWLRMSPRGSSPTALAQLSLLSLTFRKVLRMYTPTFLLRWILFLWRSGVQLIDLWLQNGSPSRALTLCLLPLLHLDTFLVLRMNTLAQVLIRKEPSLLC